MNKGNIMEQVTKENILDWLVSAYKTLDEQEVPKENRYIRCYAETLDVLGDKDFCARYNILPSDFVEIKTDNRGRLALVSVIRK